MAVPIGWPNKIETLRNSKKRGAVITVADIRSFLDKMVEEALKLP